MAPSAALRVDGVTAGYRGVAVLREVTFEVAPGQVLGLVGPNGSGKSTLLDVVCGSLRPTAGRVWLFGRDVTRLPVHRRARLGLGRTFQRLEPFSSLNIADNVLVAAELSRSRRQRAAAHAPPAIAHQIERQPVFRDPVSSSTGQPQGQPSGDETDRPEAENLSNTTGHEAEQVGTPPAVARDLLRRFGLVDFAGQPLTAVPTGVARIVEIARALAAGARVLLLDEPSSGMSEQQVKEFAETVRTLRADGLSLVLVEHDPDLIDAVCDDVLELSADHTPPSRHAAPRSLPRN